MADFQQYSKYNDPETRNIFPLPLADEFYNLLQDRLFTCVENILFQGGTNFTLIINAVPRHVEDNVPRDQSPKLIYAGLKKQREFLELFRDKIDPSTEYVKSWETLSGALIMPSNSKESATIYEQIQSGKYSIEDLLRIHRLSDYFSNISGNYAEYQKAEKVILENFFNLEKDVFISVPLIGYGEFDGVIHIVFDEHLLQFIPGYEDGSIVLPRNIVWTLTRAFITEYDGLFLDWDVVGSNIEKITAIFDFIYNTAFGTADYFNRKVGPNYPKILEELKLQTHYKIHADFFKRRLELGETVPGHIYQQYISQSVTAILIDSYAHNVSAHALSTLSWWYFRRAKMLKDEEVVWDKLIQYLKESKELSSPVLVALENEIQTRRENRKKNTPQDQTKEDSPLYGIRKVDGSEVINYPGSLARELAQLLRFLTEKGAYWGGVTRDANIGGKVSTLYSVLWYDFINNPFYLGTIAKTEDILKVTVKIIIYDPEPPGPRPDETYFHKKTYKPENCGYFATVDLTNPRKTLLRDDPKSPHATIISPFVHMDKDNFEGFRKKLKEIKIFFPGGLVGRHAFYTMIENEIRNVKHYNREELKTMQENGLILAIGVQNCSLHNSENKELYRISVWLETPTRLTRGDHHIMLSKYEAIKGEIFSRSNATEKDIKEKTFRGESIRNSTFAPLLGGNYQDKVCASFLLNGYFSYVQRGDNQRDRDKLNDTERDKNYYPWIRPACSELDKNSALNEHIDFKMSSNTPEDISRVSNLPDTGYLKKIFYVWKGESLYDSKGRKMSDWDNPARFGIVHVDEAKDELEREIIELRNSHGIVRAVSEELVGEEENERFASAYIAWIKTLFKNQSIRMAIIDGKQARYLFELSTNAETNKQDIFITDIAAKPSPDFVPRFKRVKPEEKVFIAHSTWSNINENSDVFIRYRSHGIFKSYFFPNDKLPKSNNDTKMIELFELFNTKICIFDNRIYHRLRLDEGNLNTQKIRDFHRDQLKLCVHKETQIERSEKGAGWIAALSSEDLAFLKSCHFLVMHLSFIESILQNEKPNDSSNVGVFIKEQIMPIVGERDNFFFVVTTGRGRNQWWTSLKKDENKAFAKFTLFRPVESILTAIENSISMEDDIELKYRITKLLFGS